jgi:hypothetical protein
MTSNEAVGPTDIKNLLDLLNASEEDAAPGNDSETVCHGANQNRVWRRSTGKKFCLPQ